MESIDFDSPVSDSPPSMFPGLLPIGMMAEAERKAKIAEIFEPQDEPDDQDFAEEHKKKKGWLWKKEPRPWMYVTHKFGFIGSVDSEGRGLIVPAEKIDIDEGLRDKPVNIRLNALNIFEYPGSGEHDIMVTFKAQNQIEHPEQVTFSQVFRGVNNGGVGIVGYPIFLGLNVGKSGVAFQVFTVNVKNKSDEAVLQILDSTLFKSGLNLLTSVQPAVKPLTELCTGLTKMVAGQHKNVPVQDFYLGLDFNSNHLGARLAQGDYVAVQVPSHTAVKWAEWIYDTNVQTIRNLQDAEKPFPYNYVIFNVSLDPNA